jgi:hypothetical protein
MKRTYMRLFTVLSSTLLLATAAAAQTTAVPVPAGGRLGAVVTPAPVATGVLGGWAFATAGAGMPVMPGGSVTGAPYSAVQVTEQIQTLADGTHITQSPQTAAFYRDSQGRTRTERRFPLPPGVLGKAADVPSFIDISDPVVGVHYTLEPQNHVAREMTMPAAPPPPPPPSATSAPVPTSIRILPAPLPSSAPTATDQTLRPQFSHDALGTQTIEGVLAEGSRTTVTYPVGAVGNDRPITTVSETWMSAELKMVVLLKNSDPRSGESTTRLTNISRAEPDASLFRIPSDYEVIDPQAAIPKQ